MWVRGLKPLDAINGVLPSPSHPMWVRGLKQIKQEQSLIFNLESHPMWVRGLKLQVRVGLVLLLVSHPMWVRGLKLYLLERRRTINGRTPCGCVD